jgi:hypothetical protein
MPNGTSALDIVGSSVATVSGPFVHASLRSVWGTRVVSETRTKFLERSTLTANVGLHRTACFPSYGPARIFLSRKSPLIKTYSASASLAEASVLRALTWTSN